MRVRKRLSKRVNSRQRNRIQKKVSDHHRKSRKLAKTNVTWKSKKPKDLGVPNAFPFKEQVLAEREELRRRRQEERERKRKGVKADEGVVEDGEWNGVGNGNGETNGFEKGIQIDSDEDLDEDLMEDEEEEDEESEEEDEEEGESWEDEDEESGEEMIEDESEDSEWGGIESDEVSDIDIQTLMNTARNSKVPPYVKAITRSDLLIFVLDARAPEITRSPEIEEFAAKKKKECIFVLYKAELIPSDTMQAWIDQLSAIHPTYPLLTQKSTFEHTLSPSTSLERLKSVVLNASTACLLGIPQIGKTSLLHTLLATKSRLSPTTNVKSYSLADTTLLDTPAIPATLHPLLPLLNLGKPTQQTVQYLVDELHKSGDEWYTQLEKVYGLPGLVRPIEGNRYVDPAKDLLVAVARSKGRMGRQGPNLEGAAEVVGSDCISGKIRWWMSPVLKKGKKGKGRK